jgi:hypothetical protein
MENASAMKNITIVAANRIASLAICLALLAMVLHQMIAYLAMEWIVFHAFHYVIHAPEI